MKTWQWVFTGIGSVIGLLALIWIIQGSEFFLYKTFASRQEAVRRQVFEESKAYNEGMAQEVRNMQFEYAKADAEHQKALASVILHQTAGYDISKLPPDLKFFVEGLRQERLGGSN